MLKFKVGIITVVVGSFIVGGIAFNSFQVLAVEHEGENSQFHHLWKSGEHDNLDKDSDEWKAKMEEYKARWQENGAKKGHGFRKGHGFGFMKNSDEVNHEVVNIDNGIQITITSDNPDIVTQLQEKTAMMQSKLSE